MADAHDPRGAASRARVGVVLKEKWRLDELLGVGGMAAVYAATHRNGKRVAIKMLHREYSAETEVKARFLREGYLVNKVEHRGVVGVLDDDTGDDGAAFLVMELLEGETLEQRRQRKGGKLPATEVLSIADQVLDVLATAHATEMVHRDLKPENLFLCKDGTVKVLDFGIARLRELSAKIGATIAGGTTMGTPAFMPQEQARGNWAVVDARTDLWALGATMFTLLTGQIVHEARSVTDLLVCAMSKQPSPLAARLPGAAPALAAVIDRALRFEMAERWPDARAMQTAVREAYNEVSGRGQRLLALPDLEFTGKVSADVVRAARAEAAARLAASPQAASAMGLLAKQTGSPVKVALAPAPAEADEPISADAPTPPRASSPEAAPTLHDAPLPAPPAAQVAAAPAAPMSGVPPTQPQHPHPAPHVAPTPYAPPAHAAAPGAHATVSMTDTQPRTGAPIHAGLPFGPGATTPRRSVRRVALLLGVGAAVSAVIGVAGIAAIDRSRPAAATEPDAGAPTTDASAPASASGSPR